MKIKPIFDRVVILPEERLQSQSGIVLPETSLEKPEIGQIIAVGEGVNLDGNKCEMKVKVGDKVLFNKYSGAEFKFEGKTYIIMRQIDIIGVIE